MRHKGLAVLLVLFVVASLALTGCSDKEQTPSEVIKAGTYDWDAARKLCTSDISKVLEVILVGDSNTYAVTRNEWLPRIRPNAQGQMFSANYKPPQNCTTSVVYRGYSGPEFNSEGAEYLYYDAYVLNNDSLASVDYMIIVQLERGSDGYIIAGFEKQEVSQ